MVNGRYICIGAAGLFIAFLLASQWDGDEDEQTAPQQDLAETQNNQNTPALDETEIATAASCDKNAPNYNALAVVDCAPPSTEPVEIDHTMLFHAINALENSLSDEEIIQVQNPHLPEVTDEYTITHMGIELECESSLYSGNKLCVGIGSNGEELTAEFDDGVLVSELAIYNDGSNAEFWYDPYTYKAFLSKGETEEEAKKESLWGQSYYNADGKYYRMTVDVGTVYYVIVIPNNIRMI